VVEVSTLFSFDSLTALPESARTLIVQSGSKQLSAGPSVIDSDPVADEVRPLLLDVLAVLADGVAQGPARDDPRLRPAELVAQRDGARLEPR
jgi:hypothetical protein